MQKRALIMGVAGQDGYYLAGLLAAKGYMVYGADISDSGMDGTLKTRLAGLSIIDLSSQAPVKEIIRKIRPHEIYYLAAHHYSSQDDGNRVNAAEPFLMVNLFTPNAILDLLKEHPGEGRFFYAASAHIFGRPGVSPQTETTPHNPVTPYGISKSSGLYLARYYRETFGLYTSTGILYNHESPRRQESFITTQIAHAAARAFLGNPAKLKVRDLNAVVDWGAAEDYVRAMWMTLQQPAGGEYIIASGIPHSVRDFAEVAFSHVNLQYHNFIVEENRVGPPQGLPYVGDPSRLGRVCGWEPLISFSDLVYNMVDNKIDELRKRGDGR